MRKIVRIIITSLLLLAGGIVNADDGIHFSCSFNKSIFVDSEGVYEAKKWESKGFTIKDGWAYLDSGNLKLKLTTNIQKHGIVILRGGEFKNGYQFSLENEKFVYAMLMVPLARTWTVTGSCTKDEK
ncbi:MAG: hypothetical protein ACJAVI_004665 [Candidatus Azotimanducaceae bacterium]|jgi:hypothetical protein